MRDWVFYVPTCFAIVALACGLEMAGKRVWGACLQLRFPEAVEEALADLAPNRITDYVYNLSEKFSGFYTECKACLAPALALAAACHPILMHVPVVNAHLGALLVHSRTMCEQPAVLRLVHALKGSCDVQVLCIEMLCRRNYYKICNVSGSAVVHLSFLACSNCTACTLNAGVF